MLTGFITQSLSYLLPFLSTLQVLLLQNDFISIRNSISFKGLLKEQPPVMHAVRLHVLSFLTSVSVFLKSMFKTASISGVFFPIKKKKE